MPGVIGEAYGRWTILSRPGPSNAVNGARAAHRTGKADCFSPTVKDQAAATIAKMRGDWAIYRTLDGRLAISVGTAKNGCQA